MKSFAVVVFSFLIMVQAFGSSTARPIVQFKPDFCACKDGKAVSYGNCASFCADRDTQGAEILFASFSISQNPNFKNVREWCERRPENPKCVLKARDENGVISLLDVEFDGENSITVDLTILNYNKVYVMQLEKTVQSARSNGIQFIKFLE